MPNDPYRDITITLNTNQLFFREMHKRTNKEIAEAVKNTIFTSTGIRVDNIKIEVQK